jgi:hypothetical protein
VEVVAIVNLSLSPRDNVDIFATVREVDNAVRVEAKMLDVKRVELYMLGTNKLVSSVVLIARMPLA